LHAGLALLTFFPGRVGGSETYVRGLLGQFAEGLGPERVTALTNRHGTGPLADYARGPVQLHEVRSYRAGDSTRTRALAMAFAGAAPRVAARDTPADLDLVHYPVTVPIPRTRTPRVVTLHDVQHHEMPQLFSRFERRFRAWAYDGSARSADLVIALSGHAREGIVRHAGVSPDRIVVIPHGIDHERFRPDGDDEGADLVDRLDLPERFLVYPANLWPHKNHARLVEALSLMQDREIELVLSGSDYGRLGAVEEAVLRFGVSGRVSHVGFVPDPAVPEILRRATAMVFPSLFEGFGWPPLEAMACGTPVAAAAAASLPEVCGDAALLFDPLDTREMAQAMDRVTGDEGLRARLREAGLRRAARYTWRACAERHAEAYRRVLA
jgi:glycosyltransferase involved in cell wall biosynthesis